MGWFERTASGALSMGLSTFWSDLLCSFASRGLWGCRKVLVEHDYHRQFATTFDVSVDSVGLGCRPICD